MTYVIQVALLHCAKAVLYWRTAKGVHEAVGREYVGLTIMVWCGIRVISYSDTSRPTLCTVSFVTDLASRHGQVSNWTHQTARAT